MGFVFGRIKSNEFGPVYSAICITEILDKTSSEAIDDLGISFSEFVISRFCFVTQWFDDFTVHILVARNQFPEGLTTKLYVIAFFWFRVSAVTAPIHCDQVLFLAINAFGLLEVVEHFFDLAGVSPIWT